MINVVLLTIVIYVQCGTGGKFKIYVDDKRKEKYRNRAAGLRNNHRIISFSVAKRFDYKKKKKRFFPHTDWEGMNSLHGFSENT